MAYSKKVKIMVVDDEIDLEDLVRHRFKPQITAGEYDFVFTHNGLEALSKLIEFPEIGVILCDINMPDMDGLTLLSELRELRNPSLRTVMVSAYGDMENIRTAMNRGAYDFITKPINFEDLEITINKTLNEIQLIRNAQDEHNKLLSIHQDFEVAREIQQSILPKSIPSTANSNCFDIHGHITAAKEIAGDFFDFFMINDKKLGFVVGDVSGKGVPAAIFMAVSRTLIKATGQKDLPSDEVINYVNALLCHESATYMFVTVFYGILNISTGELEYTNAGHSNPLILNRKHQLYSLEPTDGIKLGFDETFNYQARKIKLLPNDILFLYTNGVTESVNKANEMYGTERLINQLTNSKQLSPESLISEVISELSSHTKDCSLTDDIAMLAVQWHGEETE